MPTLDNVIGEFTTTGRFIPYLVPKSVETHDKPQYVGTVYDTYTTRRQAYESRGFNGNFRSEYDRRFGETYAEAEQRMRRHPFRESIFDTYERMKKDFTFYEFRASDFATNHDHAADARGFFSASARNSAIDKLTQEQLDALAEALKVSPEALKKAHRNRF